MPRKTRIQLVGKKRERIDRAVSARELRELQKELNAASREQAGSDPEQAPPNDTDWPDPTDDYEQ